MSIDVERTWRQKILPKFSVPPLLHPWQTDTISLLLNGDSVALCVPTGGGKTLPQLAASLFFDGKSTYTFMLMCIVSYTRALCTKVSEI